MQELWEEAAGQTDIGSSLTTNALFLKVWVRTVLFPQLNLLSHVHAVINDGWLGEGQSMPSSTLKCPIPRAGAGAAHSSRPLQGLGPCLGYRRCSLTMEPELIAASSGLRLHAPQAAPSCSSHRLLSVSVTQPAGNTKLWVYCMAPGAHKIQANQY